MSSPKVKLVSSDNEEFEVEWEVFRMFGLFAPQDDPKDCPSGPFPLPNIPSSILRMVLEYCEHHKHDPPIPEEPSNVDERQAPMNDWDKTFITSVSQETLFDIILAANYLSIKPLLNLGTRQVGNMIQGKTPGEIRTMFKIVNDFTPEEREQLQRESEQAHDRSQT
ncbi:hypothetical protein FS749_010408 [Ceratobasidium sp. UAMH 11750]|nr:hypothetical protein FS749_010408 [Ceratobasidium sp. UAMH 11750]